MSEWTHMYVVLLKGDVEEARDLELVGIALEVAGRCGKPVVVDLSGVGFMGADLLYELFKPGHFGRPRPWLSGPLSAYVARTFEVTGTAAAFRTFPSLMEATVAAWP
ncbi:hypothetical protein ACIQU5_16410 [Streptomyces sp. NPDC090306]|uniref:hypothetical protein n=1 Tax=Streptomyces sp. NPDC090306 TaxID=3365961 RepID=UPI00382FC605